MSELTISAGQSAPPRVYNQNRPEHYKIGRKLERALNELVNNGANQAKAAQVSGLRAETLSRALRKPHVQERMKGLLDERKLLLGTKALATLDRCMDDKSGYVRVQAASKVADITGHTKEQGEGRRDTVLNVQINIG